MIKAISLSIFVIGFTAMASQIVFMRELLIVFNGNELSIGFILASWLLGGAAGSGLLGRFADKARLKINLFLSCQIALAIILPFEVIAIRLIRTALHLNPGEIMPLSYMAVSSLAVLVPVCALLGFIFTIACRIYGITGTPSSIRIGRVYFLEAIGSIAGGLLASFILIWSLNSVSIAVLLGILNIICIFVISLTFLKEIKFRTFFLFMSNFLLAIFVLMWPLKVWDGLDRRSLASEWRGHELISAKNSVYGNIVLTKRGSEYSFFDNGLHLYTVPDRQTSEEAAHFAMLEHPDPRDILLIGGGAGGIVQEILKYPVKRIDYVELDPLIIKMAIEYLPGAYSSPLSDARVSIINSDGRFFVKTAKRKYDCIIMRVGDPLTAELNRFYTVEFFREIKKILKDGGVVSFAVTSSEDYINAELGRFLSSIYRTLAGVFPDVKVMPGNTAYFLASMREGLLTCDYNVFMERARQRNIGLEYVREYYLSARLSPQRISYIKGIMDNAMTAKINHDLKPVAYYYDMIFRASYFRDSVFKRLFESVTEKQVWIAILILSIFSILAVSFGSWRKARFSNAVLITMAVSGFSMMAFQILILLSFQVIYGYFFYKLGIILTSFMVGLALGSRRSTRLMSPGRKDEKIIFGLTPAAILVYSLAVPALIGLLNNTGTGPLSWLGRNVIFPSLSILAGFIGGFQFPLAGKLCMREEEGAGRLAGFLYGTDLAGSCIGALATGAFLTPVLGIAKTFLVVAVLNLIILIMFPISAGGRQNSIYVIDN